MPHPSAHPPASFLFSGHRAFEEADGEFFKGPGEAGLVEAAVADQVDIAEAGDVGYGNLDQVFIADRRIEGDAHIEPYKADEDIGLFNHIFRGEGESRHAAVVHLDVVHIVFRPREEEDFLFQVCQPQTFLVGQWMVFAQGHKEGLFREEDEILIIHRGECGFKKEIGCIVSGRVGLAFQGIVALGIKLPEFIGEIGNPVSGGGEGNGDHRRIDAVHFP